MYSRKNLRKIAAATAAVSGLLLSSFGTFTAAQADQGMSPSVVSSGNWGAADSGLTWEYDSDSVLTVMCDKDPGQQCEIPSTGMTSGDYRAPWHKQRLVNKPIEKIVFKDTFDSDTQIRRFKLPELSRGLFTRDPLSASGPNDDDANALTQVTEIEGSEYLDTSAVSLMNNMFWGMKNLPSLNVTGWDTTNVTDFTGMLSTSGPLSTLILGKDTKLGADVASDAIGPNFGPEWAKGVEAVVPEDIKDQRAGNWKQVEPASSDWVGPTFGDESLVARSLSGDGAGTYIWETTEPLRASRCGRVLFTCGDPN